MRPAFLFSISIMVATITRSILLCCSTWLTRVSVYMPNHHVTILLLTLQLCHETSWPHKDLKERGALLILLFSGVGTWTPWVRSNLPVPSLSWRRGVQWSLDPHQAFQRAASPTPMPCLPSLCAKISTRRWQFGKLHQLLCGQSFGKGAK